MFEESLIASDPPTINGLWRITTPSRRNARTQQACRALRRPWTFAAKGPFSCVLRGVRSGGEHPRTSGHQGQHSRIDRIASPSILSHVRAPDFKDKRIRLQQAVALCKRDDQMMVSDLYPHETSDHLIVKKKQIQTRTYGTARENVFRLVYFAVSPNRHIGLHDLLFGDPPIVVLSVWEETKKHPWLFWVGKYLFSSESTFSHKLYGIEGHRAPFFGSPFPHFISATATTLPGRFSWTSKALKAAKSTSS